MRFQASKIIDGEDPEVILRVLAICFQEVSLDVVRDGCELTVHGLGPSLNVINRLDTAIYRVEAQDGRIVIRSDVSYQIASAVSDIPQDIIVRLKLESIFAHMAVVIADEERRRELGLSTRINASAQIIPVAQVAASAISEETVATPPGDARYEKPKQSQLSPTVQLALPMPVARRFQILMAAVISIVTLFLLGSVFYFVQHNRRNTTPLPVSIFTTARSPASPPIESVGQTHIAAAEPQSYPVVADPNAWLKYWVTAMRTRDPAAQASFYADSLDQYQGKRHFSNAEIYRDKETAIENRKGLWTVKLEKIVVFPQDKDTATIRLVKHYMSQTEPAQISEQFVQSRLKLKRINGEWKIISEEDLVNLHSRT
jgi:hypothetical protein